MKTYRELVNEVARAQSPADREFVALHRISKRAHPVATENQFKGGTEKDETKLSHPSNETGVETAVAGERPLGESWRDHLNEDATPSSSGLTKHHIEKALKNGGHHLDPGVHVSQAEYKGKADKGPHHVYHVKFSDEDHSLAEPTKVYVKKNDKGVHVAEF